VCKGEPQTGVLPLEKGDTENDVWPSPLKMLSVSCWPGPKFTDDLRTILRQFSDLQQSYDNWQIHGTFTTIVRPILRRHLTIGF